MLFNIGLSYSSIRITTLPSLLKSFFNNSSKASLANLAFKVKLKLSAILKTISNTIMQNMKACYQVHCSTIDYSSTDNSVIETIRMLHHHLSVISMCDICLYPMAISLSKFITKQTTDILHVTL